MGETRISDFLDTPIDVVMYFSEAYASRAVLLSRSIKRYLNGGKIHAMVTDDTAIDAASQEGFEAYRLDEIRRLRQFSDWGQKSFSENLFTVGPTFLLEVLKTLPLERRVLYLNSDTYFFSDPRKIWENEKDWDILLFPHHYSKLNKIRLRKYGLFNAGAMAINNSANSQLVIANWAEKCEEWCYDSPLDGKYADQKYLESFSLWGPRVSESKDRRANLAPWTSGAKKSEYKECIFYHFHGLSTSRGRVILPHLQYLRLSKGFERAMHVVYLTELDRVEQSTGHSSVLSPRKSEKRRALKKIFLLASEMLGNVVTRQG